MAEERPESEVGAVMLYTRSCCGCVDVVGEDEHGREVVVTIPHGQVATVARMLEKAHRAQQDHQAAQRVALPLGDGGDQR